jgi:hypothetical protein
MNIEKRENVEHMPHGRTTWPNMGMPRRVALKGMQGVDATVVVIVVQDTVWMSISPTFTWEAIMEPENVDQVISILELARNEAKNVATSNPSRGYSA